MDRPLTPPAVGIAQPPDLVRRYTSLELSDRLHLERLMASWSLLADFSFSDLLLFVPIASQGWESEVHPDTGGRGSGGAKFGELSAIGVEPGGSELWDTEPAELGSPGAFIVIGQIRPTTSQTLYEADLVGQVQPAPSWPQMVEAYQTGVIVRGEHAGEAADSLVRITYIPVSQRGKVLGVLCRVWSPGTTRRRGTLERVYLELFERLSIMVTDGLFPFADEDAAVEEAPRVGDGVLVVDARERITYASPNAVNALHRASITSAIVGSSLALLGLETSVVGEAFSRRLPVIEEVERRPDVILMIRCIPLIARSEVTGAAILVRDMTDLRRRDRLLLTKDATIREVHHRVKNNLQTISSLLRLQARRLDAEEAQGRIALLEAERRIRAIAVVHDILAREATEQVPFDEIVPALVDVVRETNMTPFPVAIEVDGGLGEVAAEVATPLAVAVAELLQNAMEHAFAGPSAAGRAAGHPHPVSAGAAKLSTSGRQPSSEVAPELQARVDLILREHPDSMEVVVRDNGCGLPPDFDVDKTRSLGLSIVRDLIRSQLGGTIKMETDGGTVVRLEIPSRRRAG